MTVRDALHESGVPSASPMPFTGCVPTVMLGLDRSIGEDAQTGVASADVAATVREGVTFETLLARDAGLESAWSVKV